MWAVDLPRPRPGITLDEFTPPETAMPAPVPGTTPERPLATVSNDTVVRFWDPDTGQEKAAYGWQIGPLKAVTFAPDGQRAAASGKKGTIIVWDVE